MTPAAPVARNYFAIRATGDLSVVLISGDDFADLVERRRILESITGGVKLAIVWGLDGAPVTRAQAERLLNPEEYEVSIERLVDSDVVVDGKTRKESRTVVSTEKRTRPRADPRSIRPEVRPGCPPARRELPPLVDELAGASTGSRR